MITVARLPGLGNMAGARVRLRLKGAVRDASPEFGASLVTTLTCKPSEALLAMPAVRVARGRGGRTNQLRTLSESRAECRSRSSTSLSRRS